jgi:hypothetical protein
LSCDHIRIEWYDGVGRIVDQGLQSIGVRVCIGT